MLRDSDYIEQVLKLEDMNNLDNQLKVIIPHVEQDWLVEPKENNVSKLLQLFKKQFQST